MRFGLVFHKRPDKVLMETTKEKKRKKKEKKRNTHAPKKHTDLDSNFGREAIDHHHNIMSGCGNCMYIPH